MGSRYWRVRPAWEGVAAMVEVMVAVVGMGVEGGSKGA